VLPEFSLIQCVVYNGSVISCPKCNATLPDWAQTCQFCQTDVRSIARPKPVTTEPRRIQAFVTPQWIWGAYYGLCVLFILEGGYDIAQPFIASHQKFMGQEMGMGFFSYISIAFGAFTALLGIGLLLRAELARGIVNVVCGIRILLGLLGLFGSLGGTLIFGAFGLLMVVMNIVDIATAGFMIFLIGETDKAAPNL
jgi:hypothetical protein